MSSLLVFPGQGAQQPGMLRRLPDVAVVRECLGEASDVLGENLGLLDTEQALASTRAVQLCLLVAGVAGARLLLENSMPPAYVAGLSGGGRRRSAGFRRCTAAGRPARPPDAAGLSTGLRNDRADRPGPDGCG